MSLPPTDISREIYNDIIAKTGHPIRTMSRVMEGQSHKVYQITLGHSEDQYCLRIAKDEDAQVFARRGMEVLKYVKRIQPSLRAPHVILESDSYTILQYLTGEPIGCWNTQLLSRNRRLLLLKGLAAFLFALWTCPAKSHDDTAPAVTYSDWLRSEVDKGFRRSLQGAGWGDPVHFLFRRMIIPSHVPVDDDMATAPKHGDLNAWNVLVDAAGFTGLTPPSVIDWDTARILPLPTAVQHPMFIADIPGWHNDGVPEGMTFEQDREALEQEVRRLAATSASSIAQRVPGLLSSSYERHFFEQSLRNKVINAKYIHLRSTPNGLDNVGAANELESLLAAHPDLRSHPEVLKLKTRLSVLGV